MAYKPEKNVLCNACGCAFIPEMLTQREGEIEYTFFRCDYSLSGRSGNWTSG